MDYYNEEYLMHYGIKGMKWGVRKVRGHAGPGKYVTRKRQLAGDKKDLKYLENGGHLSVGLTKKRQEKLDKRDKTSIEKRIAKNEEKLAKQSVKELSKTKNFNKGLKTVGRLLSSTIGPDKRFESHAERSQRESLERMNKMGKAPTFKEERERMNKMGKAPTFKEEREHRNRMNI